MSDVSIIYCRPCGYEKRAKDAAAGLRGRLAVEARLVPGTGGIFAVRVGEETVAKRSKGHSRPGRGRRRGCRRTQVKAQKMPVGWTDDLN